ncbi:ribosome hibernation-promoting factor, HPF/YfiA family [Sedimentisphaera salicampi]|uniref:Ribosome hibernation promoting factor HPF n=1 Tax=Sedimentisphaera salicampi TaxID=1941349 RepID=A0A1W6LL46_9BACT|nr:ribosome-associated translation inhibitor RaiA [Sedimentisphaera salicampi]ARN56476.1 ribosome hibernation promoting factor HPF [Sedimentisphaera salicampi]OXU15362.1 ribosome hibernation promoting factor HPF [Sedimentisphaera salicampi]
MELKLTGRHFEVTRGIKEHVELKANKLPKFYSSVESIETIIDGGEGKTTKVEVITKGGHNPPLVVKVQGEEDDNLFKIIDEAFEKAERQLKKIKEKERNPMHAG